MPASIVEVRREWSIKTAARDLGVYPSEHAVITLTTTKRAAGLQPERLKHARQLARCTIGHTYHGAMLIQFTQNHSERQPLASGYRFLKSILDRLEALPAVQTFLTTVAAQRKNGRPGYPPNAMFRALAPNGMSSGSSGG